MCSLPQRYLVEFDWKLKIVSTLDEAWDWSGITPIVCGITQHHRALAGNKRPGKCNWYPTAVLYPVGNTKKWQGPKIYPMHSVNGCLEGLNDNDCINWMEALSPNLKWAETSELQFISLKLLVKSVPNVQNYWKLLSLNSKTKMKSLPLLSLFNENYYSKSDKWFIWNV